MDAFILGQVLSAFSGLFLLICMRSRNKIRFLFFNSISNLFGCISMLVLGAYAATIGPIVLTLQGVITYHYKKYQKEQPRLLLALYLLLNIFGGILTVNSILGILPIISSSLASIMLMTKHVKTSRKINLISSLLALPYLIMNKDYMSAVIFGSSFLNTLHAIYKIDYKEKYKENE